MCAEIADAIMNSPLCLLLCLSTAFLFVSHVHSLSTSINGRPIIGILAHEFHSSALNDEYPNQYDSYIAASYVKFVEGAGAMVVPIWIGKEESYYEDIISKVNGILLPGGSARLFHKNGFADAGTFIYKIASRLNIEGDYFPIWGTCLGFQLLTYVASGGVEHRTDCASRLQSLPLEFVSGYESSRIFQNATTLMINILSNHNVTTNYHRRCVTREVLKNLNLTSEFRVMSINHDFNGLEFISTIEHVDFPFYGTQFHPETNLYEWMEPEKYITHTAEATLASQYFANFFVNEARKNSHSYPDGTEIDELIYNYALTFTARKNLPFTQCYMFANETKND